MSRNAKSSSTATGRVGLIVVLGAGIGSAVGAVLGNMPLGIGVGAVLGLLAGGVREFIRWRKRARPD